MSLRTCLKDGCNRPTKPGKKTFNVKKVNRRKRAFCKLHSGLRTQMSKDAYNELRGVSPLRKHR